MKRLEGRLIRRYIRQVAFHAPFDLFYKVGDRLLIDVFVISLQILRKLVKKHKLVKGKREKIAIYIEDLIEYFQTNLITTKKQYMHG